MAITKVTGYGSDPYGQAIKGDPRGDFIFGVFKCQEQKVSTIVFDLTPHIGGVRWTGAVRHTYTDLIIDQTSPFGFIGEGVWNALRKLHSLPRYHVMIESGNPVFSLSPVFHGKVAFSHQMMIESQYFNWPNPLGVYTKVGFSLDIPPDVIGLGNTFWQGGELHVSHPDPNTIYFFPNK